MEVHGEHFKTILHTHLGKTLTKRNALSEFSLDDGVCVMRFWSMLDEHLRVRTQVVSDTMKPRG